MGYELFLALVIEVTVFPRPTHVQARTRQPSWPCLIRPKLRQSALVLRTPYSL